MIKIRLINVFSDIQIQTIAHKKKLTRILNVKLERRIFSE